ncbi:IS481 family transposase [Amycolatopsis sp. NPDC006125]|uniref:IS481 family transposase n=4 Tax=Amycolatopsis TaxID=1813 RepID=UPI0033BF71E9
MSHRNARLTEYGRRLLVERVAAGRPVAHVAAEMGVSRATGHKWVRRFREEGQAGLADRTSRPHTSPTRVSAEVEQEVLRLRQDRRLGPARIAGILGMVASTVHRILVRRGMPKLAGLDRPTGEPIRHYERDRPGELVHVDVKKLGRLREGGGWWAHGRGSDQHKAARRAPRVGFEFVHCAVDDHSRLAYAEIHPDETATTCAAFLRRAAQAFAAHGIPAIERVMTDNALAYRRSLAFRTALADIGASHRFTRAYRPQTNGKAERFNRTLAEEWAYAQPFTNSEQRANALPDFLHHYNHHRTHTALNGQPPITRVDNLTGHYT